MVKQLILYEDYTREDVHEIFAPQTKFTPSSGTWGLQGIVAIPSRNGDYVFFVTYGQSQGDHQFREWVSEDGVISWQSQPKQSLNSPVIQQFIYHNETQNSIYLFLRTSKGAKYTYLGELKYLSHDPDLENPVYMRWQILSWNLPIVVRERTGLRLAPTAKPAFKGVINQTGYAIDTDKKQKSLFVWRQKTYSVNHAEIISKIRNEIKDGLPIEATRFHDWCIEVDGALVSQKWVFHLITNADYNEFDATTAREKLTSVGFVVERASEKYSTNVTAANPQKKYVFYQAIASILPSKISKDVGPYEIKTLKSKGQLEIHFSGFPKRANYVVRRQGSGDQISFWYVWSKDKNQEFIDELKPYQDQLSRLLNTPVVIDHYWERIAIARIAIDISEEERVAIQSANTSLAEEANIYAAQIAGFIKATYPIIKEYFEVKTLSQHTQPANVKKPKESYRVKDAFSVRKGGRKINNATYYSLSELLFRLFQVGEIKNEILNKLFGLRDYHYNYLLQSGLVFWTPESICISPRFLQMVKNKSDIRTKEELMRSLGINNLRDWDDFFAQTYFAECHDSINELNDEYIYKAKTINIWDDPVTRPCFLVDYLDLQASGSDMPNPAIIAEPKFWNNLSVVFREPKKYVHSTLPIEYPNDETVQLALWQHPFFALGLQMAILSDRETGGLYEYKITLELIDGLRKGGKLNVYLDSQYICDLREITKLIFDLHQWIWINQYLDIIIVFQALHQIGVLDLERNGRVILENDFRLKLLESNSSHNRQYRQTRIVRDEIREFIKQFTGLENG